jgi:pyrimidine operon attenuation protein/uracil phosphoribosyltransferase
MTSLVTHKDGIIARNKKQRAYIWLGALIWTRGVNTTSEITARMTDQNHINVPTPYKENKSPYRDDNKPEEEKPQGIGLPLR